MTPVLFTFVTPDGVPVADTDVEIQLTKSGYDDDITGVIMPRPVVATTDTLGQVTVPLTPSPTLYVVTVEDKVSEAALSYQFIVPVMEDPEAVVRMQDIVVAGPVSDTPYDEAAILVIHAAKANAMAAQVAAEAARDAAAASASSIVDSVTSSSASAADALVSKAAALASQNAAHASEVASNASAVDAAASAATASGSKDTAVNAATTATTKAAAALASQTAAAASELASSKMVPHFGPTPQADPVNNAVWIDSDSGRKYTWLQDGTSAQWVETGAVVAVGFETALQAKASADAAAISATSAASSASRAGISNVGVDVNYDLLVTRSDGTTYNAGYVRGPQGAAFSVDAIGSNLAGRAAYNAQPDGFSYLDTGAGNLYFREGDAAGVWSTAVPFGKGEKGDTGTTDFNALSNKPALGTAAPLNVAAAGNAGAAEVVKGNDTRLSDARAPTAHSHTAVQISDATATGLTLLKAATVAAARSILLVDQVNNTADADKPISTATAAALAGKEPSIAAGGLGKFWRGDKTWQTLTKNDVGLPLVDNTPDASKSVNYANVSGASQLAVKASSLASGGNNGAQMIFQWYDDGSYPGYLWGSIDGTNMRVFPPGRLSVNYANTANYANSCGSAAGVNGRSVTYRTGNNDTTMRWDGGSIILGVDNNEFGGTAPMNVRYAGTSGYCNGSAENANRFQGQDGNYWLNNGNTAVRNLRNNGSIQLYSGLAGYGDVWWSVNPSDADLKENIVPTAEDSLEKICRISFKSFNYKVLESGFEIDDGRTHKVGATAQQLQEIDPDWVFPASPWLQPDTNKLLWEALHAIKQLEARVAALESNQ